MEKSARGGTVRFPVMAAMLAGCADNEGVASRLRPRNNSDTVAAPLRETSSTPSVTRHMTVTNKGPAGIVTRVPKTEAAEVAILKPKWAWQIVKIEFVK